jgi:hypothetical protein
MKMKAQIQSLTPAQKAAITRWSKRTGLNCHPRAWVKPYDQAAALARRRANARRPSGRLTG